MPNSSYADVTTDWEQLLTKVTANATDLAFLEDTRAALATVLQSAKEANGRQATFKAEFGQATRDLESHLAAGKDLATRLRNGIRTRYGLKGEKLTDFKLRPRRTRKSKTPTPDPVPPPVVEPAPAAAAQAPTTTQK
jgi:hypothetical protein